MKPISQAALGRSLSACLLVPVFAHVPASLAQAGGTILEDVVVTAQRRAQSADDVPIAINAFSGERLRDLGVVDVSGLAIHTPGMTMTETGITGVPVYTIRGVGFDDYNSNSASTVGIYEDEINLPYPTMTRGPQFDLDRVEVLKGPQGTLYGRNTTGGAINLISSQPQEEFDAGLVASYDRFGTFDGEGFLTGALAENLLGRAAMRVRQSDEGWQESSSRSGDTLGAVDQWAGRVILNWAPADSLDLTFKVAGYRDRSENLAPQYNDYVPLVPDLAPFFPPPPVETRPDPDDNREADWSATLRPERDNTGRTVASTLNWSLSGATLTSITAYSDFDRSEVNDWDGSFVENLDVVFDTDISVFSQELRLASDGAGDLQWVAGLYYAEDEVEESWKALGSESTIFQGAFGTVDTRYDQTDEAWAAFGQMDWQFASQWSVSLGLRYTGGERDYSACTYDVDGGLAFVYAGYDQGPIPGFADHFYLSSTALQTGDCVTVDTASPSFSFDPDTGELTVYGGESGMFRDSEDYDEVSGRIVLSWMPTEDALVYASFSDGYKSGGYNGAAASTWTQFEPYDAESLHAWELGAKLALADNALRLRGALFYYDYQDKQVLGFIADDVFGPLTRIVNVPESTVQGGELELEWQVSEGLVASANAAWLDSEIEDFVGLDATAQLRDYEGQSLAQTPEWQLGGQILFRRPVGDSLVLRMSADVIYSDKYYAGMDKSDLYLVDNFTVWNAQIGIGAQDGRWSIELFGRNLFDENYYTSANMSNDYWYRTRGEPLNYGVRVRLAR